MSKRSFAVSAPGLALSLCLATAHVACAGEHRELAAHEHGHGTLNIAVEGTSVKLELEAPGADIVGFEHEPSTDDDKKVFEAAKAALAMPLELLRPSEAAKCSVKETKVSVREEEHEDAHGDTHEAGHKDDHDDHKGETEAEAHHNAFYVEYTLTCDAVGELKSLDLNYFTAFPKAQRLTVTAISANGQSQAEASAKVSKVDLSGLMD